MIKQTSLPDFSFPKIVEEIANEFQQNLSNEPLLYPLYYKCDKYKMESFFKTILSLFFNQPIFYSKTQIRNIHSNLHLKNKHITALKNYVSQILRNQKISEDFIQQGLKKIEEIRELIHYKKPVQQIIQSKYTHQELICNFFEQLGCEEALVYFIKADHQNLLGFTNIVFQHLFDDPKNNNLLKCPLLIQKQIYNLQFTAQHFYLYKKHLANFLEGLDLNSEQMLKMLRIAELQRPFALNMEIKTNTQQVRENFYNEFINIARQFHLNFIYNNHSKYKRVSYLQHQKLMIDFMLSKQEAYTVDDLQNIHQHANIGPQFFDLQNQIFEITVNKLAPFILLPPFSLTQFKGFITNVTPIYQAIKGYKKNELLDQISYLIEMKTLENKSIGQTFIKENINLKVHNKRMLSIVLNGNESFTSTDIKEAHEKLDLNEHQVQSYIYDCIDALKETFGGVNMHRGFMTAIQEIFESKKMLLINKK